MYSRVKNERETEYGFREYMKKHSYLYYCTLKNTKIDFDCKIFEKVSEFIWFYMLYSEYIDCDVMINIWNIL